MNSRQHRLPQGILTLWAIVLLSLLVVFQVEPARAMGADSLDLAKATVVVQPNYSEQTFNFLVKLRKQLLRWSYDESADMLSHFERGGAASGTIVRYQQSYYVLTTCQAVNLTTNVDIALPGGAGGLLKHCRILYSDESLGLALVALPEFYQPEAFFLLDSGATPPQASELLLLGYLSDAEQVIPQRIQANLLDGPSIPDRIQPLPPQALAFSQHINYDVAGGPLLMPQAGQASGYDLLGVTIWRAALGDKLGLAIPKTTLVQFIEQGLRLSATENLPALEQAAKQLVLALRDTTATTPVPLSDAYIAHQPMAQTVALLDMLSDSMQQAVADRFDCGLPLAGVRQVLQTAFAQAYSHPSTTLKACNLSTYSEGIAEVKLVQNDTILPLVMEFTPRGWLLQRIEHEQGNELLLRLQQKAKQAPLASQWRPMPQQTPTGRLLAHLPYRVQLWAGLVVPFASKEHMQYELGIGYMLLNYMSVNLQLYYGSCDIVYINQEPLVTSMRDTITNCHYLGFTPSLGAQLPLHLNRSFFIPYIRIGLGTHFPVSKHEAFKGKTVRRTYYGLAAGLNYSYQLSPKLHLLLGAEWKLSYGKSTLEDNDLIHPNLFSSVALRAGVGF